MNKPSSKFINFVDVSNQYPNRITETYSVQTNDDNAYDLGFVQWYAPWRRYTFMPEPNTVFEPVCLGDIANFIKYLMHQRKNQRAGQGKTDNT
jgi:hypothetical protein